jgi:hypothetical protein
MTLECLTRGYDDEVKSAGCAYCGGPLPPHRAYEHFCKESCQKAVDDYIVSVIQRRLTSPEPALLKHPKPAA